MQIHTNLSRILSAATGVVLSVIAGTSVSAACGGMEIQAHRGAPLYPENSLDGVIAALENPNYSGVEIDVYKLADGAHVLHHDPIPGRVVHHVRPAQISSLTTRDWERARLVGYSDVRPSFLEETLHYFVEYRHPHQKLNIELKDNHTGGGTNCARERDLHTLVSAILPSGSWAYSTPHLDVMKCLTTVQSDIYVGLVLAPSDSELEKKHSDIVEVAREGLAARLGDVLTNKLENVVRTGYRSYGSQGAFLSPQRRKELVQHLRGRGGVHLGTGLAEENVHAISELASQGVSIYTFGINGDPGHAAAIRRLEGAGVRVSGAIIDDDPQQFCSML